MFSTSRFDSDGPGPAPRDSVPEPREPRSIGPRLLAAGSAIFREPRRLRAVRAEVAVRQLERGRESRAGRHPDGPDVARRQPHRQQRELLANVRASKRVGPYDVLRRGQLQQFSISRPSSEPAVLAALLGSEPDPQLPLVTLAHDAGAP